LVTTSALVVGIDQLLAARVRAGSDAALRLSVLLPYLGVTAGYQLARACGFAALVLFAMSLALGLETGRDRALGRERPLLAVLHRQSAMLGLALVLAHGLVPLAATDPPYGGLATVVVAFHQPYFWGRRADAFDALGIVATYLLVLSGPTYYLISRRARLFARVHLLVALAYLAILAHVCFLGSDFLASSLARDLLIGAQVPLALELRRRFCVPVSSAGATRRNRLMRNGAAALAVALVLGLVASLAGAP
jgi:hypothetical protein